MFSAKITAILIFLLIELLLFIFSYFFSANLMEFGSKTSLENFVHISLGTFAIFLAAYIWLDDIQKKEMYSQFSSILMRVDSLTNNVSALKQDDFYDEFRQKIGRASSIVWISHLDVSSPMDYGTPRSVTMEYYAEFTKTVRKKKNVEFRRVERLSVTKAKWIRHLIKRLDGKDNFSLAVLREPEQPSTTVKLPHISVQIIDTQLAYLVAIARHEDRAAPRDVGIYDGEAARLWAQYYESVLWENSIILVDRGVVAEEIVEDVLKPLEQRQ